VSGTGQALLLCGQGHAQTQPGGRFCGQCGAPVLPAAAPGEPACAVHPHLRAEQPCARCGNFACRACLRAGLDGSAICAACESREATLDLPWDRRAEIGAARAFLKTCWEILLHPTSTLQRARPDAGLGSSLWFAVLADTATVLTTALLEGVGLGVVALNEGAQAVDLPAARAAGWVGGFMVLMGVGLVLTGVGVTLVSSALDHLVLHLAGAAPYSFQRTVRAHALSLAPALAGVVPVCGPYVVVIWALVIRVFAYRALHRTTTGQAIAGALVVPAVVAGLAFAGWLSLFLIASGLSGS
jgi:hypothetical protein